MFGSKCITEIKEQVGQLLEAYRNKIDDAYMRTPKALIIGLSVRLKPGRDHEVLIETSLSMVAERLRDKTHGQVDERQMTLTD